MGSPNLCSKAWVTSQYDRYVQGNTASAMPDDAGVLRVDETTHRGVAIATDANGRYTVAQARTALRAFSRFELEYVEQPCATVEDLAHVRKKVDVPIAADESIRRAADPYRVAELGAADVAVCKVAPLGGVDKLLRIARDLNLDVILDVSVTLSMEVGRARVPIRNLLQLNQGSVVELDRVAGEPLDVLVNGTLIAHGEVVVVNEKFGIRMTDVISPSERIKKLR